MPALKQLTMEERQTLLDVTERLIEVDQRFKPFEFVLVTILEKHLAKTSGQIKPVRFRTLDAVLPEIRLLLSTLARSGSAAKVQADAAFARAILNFTPANMAPAAEAACTMEGLRNALDRLALLSPLLKRPIIQVCADCVLHDGLLQPEEGELLRAVAERLDCPMPPLVA